MKVVLPNASKTWLSYIDSVRDQVSEEDHLQIKSLNSLFNVSGLAKKFMQHTVPIVYVLDYRSRTYLNMSENFAGYNAKSFIEGGLQYTTTVFRKDYLKLFNEEIFPDRLKLLSMIPAQEHKNYVFTVSVEINNKNGEQETFLQRNTFISDRMGNPTYSMGLLVNVNHLSNGSPNVQTVEKMAQDGTNISEFVLQKTYFKNQEDKLFSKAEKRVLECIADGLSCKMIASKLYISEHTVVNHRRNMEMKANVPNVAALVSFAVRKGLI